MPSWTSQPSVLPSKASRRCSSVPSSFSKPLSTTRSRVPSPSAASVNSTSVELPSSGSSPQCSRIAAQRYEKRRGGSRSHDPRAADAVLGPAHHHLAAGPEVDLGAVVAEPAPDVLRLRQQRPHPLDGRGDHGLAFDLHGNLPNRRVTTGLHIRRRKCNPTVTPHPWGCLCAHTRTDNPTAAPRAIARPVECPSASSRASAPASPANSACSGSGPMPRDGELEQRRRQRGRARAEISTDQSPQPRLPQCPRPIQ